MTHIAYYKASKKNVAYNMIKVIKLVWLEVCQEICLVSQVRPNFLVGKNLSSRAQNFN